MWWIIPAVIGALLLLAVTVIFLPVGLRIIYDREGLKLRLLIGFIPVKISLSELNTIQKNSRSKTTGKADEDASENKVIRPDGSLSEFSSLIKFVLQLVFNEKYKFCVKLLEMNLIMANDDPFDLAMNYGRAQAIIHALMPQLERFLNIKKRKIDIACDFLAEQTMISVRADLLIPAIRLLKAFLDFKGKNKK